METNELFYFEVVAPGKPRFAPNKIICYQKENSWINPRVNPRVKIMARRRLENRYIRKITKTGRGQSYTVILPIEAIRLFGWQSKQKVVVKIDKRRKRFVVEDWKK